MHFTKIYKVRFTSAQTWYLTRVLDDEVENGNINWAAVRNTLSLTGNHELTLDSTQWDDIRILADKNIEKSKNQHDMRMHKHYLAPKLRAASGMHPHKHVWEMQDD